MAYLPFGDGPRLERDIDDFDDNHILILVIVLVCVLHCLKQNWPLLKHYVS